MVIVFFRSLVRVLLLNEKILAIFKKIFLVDNYLQLISFLDFIPFF